MEDERNIQRRLERVLARRKSPEGEAGASRLRHLEDSRKRLLAILRKKSTTSFIGALALFEEFFGELWGQGVPEGQLNEEERYWRGLWNECRFEVLNNGNNQLRAAESALMQYDVDWKRYSITTSANRSQCE